MTARLDRLVTGARAVRRAALLAAADRDAALGATWQTQLRVGPGVYEIKLREPHGRLVRRSRVAHGRA